MALRLTTSWICSACLVVALSAPHVVAQEADKSKDSPKKPEAANKDAAKKDAANSDKAKPDNKPANKPMPARAKAEARKEAVNPQSETSALAFAREHHAELAGLLESLKESNRKEYDRGIQELARTNERLTRLREKFPESYKSELKIWQLESKIRLLQARMAMSDDPQWEQEIRELLKQRANIRLARLRDERAQAEKAVQRLDSRIAETEKSLNDEALDAELARMRTSMAANRDRKKATKPDTAPKPKTGKPAVERSAIDRTGAAGGRIDQSGNKAKKF